jgi:competence protein ComEC
MVSKSNKTFWLLLNMILVFVCIIVWVGVIVSNKQSLQIKFYDVGQGDSTFIQTPAGYKILIDGGPNNKVVNYLDKDLPIWDRRIDLLVLTHPQADHLFGLVEVLRRFEVKNVIVSGASNSTAIYRLWRKVLQEEQINPKVVTNRDIINTSDAVNLKILWPEESQPLVSDLNEASIVMKLSYGDFDVLLTGDADEKVQPYPGNIKNVEVLKIPHHGSQTAMQEKFLKELNPEATVISVGKRNTYGHPGEKLLKNLSIIDTKIFRTDQNGTVEIVSDGKKWYTSTERR